MPGPKISGPAVFEGSARFVGNVADIFVKAGDVGAAALHSPSSAAERAPVTLRPRRFARLF
jgi:hypothetical protein